MSSTSIRLAGRAILASLLDTSSRPLKLEGNISSPLLHVFLEQFTMQFSENQTNFA
jgi:hypothetical protein